MQIINKIFNFITIIIIFSATISAAPIADEQHQALKNVLESIEIQISKWGKWKVEKCHANNEFPDEKEPMEMIGNFMKILKNPQENLDEIGVNQLLGSIRDFMNKFERIMTKYVKSIPNYADWRFNEAIRVEENRLINTDKKFQLGTQEEIEKAAGDYLTKFRLKDIRGHIEMVNILQKLTTSEKQQEYDQYFLMCFCTMKDLKKELDEAKKHLAKIPEYYGELTEEMCDNVLCGDNNPNLLCWCCPCVTAARVAAAAVCYVALQPVEAVHAIRRRCAKCKIRKIEEKSPKLTRTKPKLREKWPLMNKKKILLSIFNF